MMKTFNKSILPLLAITLSLGFTSGLAFAGDGPAVSSVRQGTWTADLGDLRQRLSTPLHFGVPAGSAVSASEPKIPFQFDPRGGSFGGGGGRSFGGGGGGFGGGGRSFGGGSSFGGGGRSFGGGGGSFGGGRSFGGSSPRSNSGFGGAASPRTSPGSSSFNRTGGFPSSGPIRSTSVAPSYAGRGGYSSRSYGYMGGYYPARYYGGFSDYSYGWASPAWYFWTPFHPAFYYSPPVYYNGAMYPGDFSFFRLFVGIVIFFFILWLIGRLLFGGGGGGGFGGKRIKYTNFR